jgi:hypothetical protein
VAGDHQRLSSSAKLNVVGGSVCGSVGVGMGTYGDSSSTIHGGAGAIVNDKAANATWQRFRLSADQADGLGVAADKEFYLVRPVLLGMDLSNFLLDRRGATATVQRQRRARKEG